MRLRVDRNNILYFLVPYVIGIFIWDYTLVYQIALVVLVALTFMLYKGKVVNNTYLVGSYALLFAYFLLHTIMAGSSDLASTTRYFLTMGINLSALICLGKILSTREKIEYIMKVCIWTAFSVCVYIILIEAANLFSGSLSWGALKPFTSERYGHNEVAILAATSTLFLVYFSMERKPFPGKTPLIIFFSIFVILTGARRSFLLSMVALIAYPVLFPQIKATTAKNITFLVLKAIVVVLGVLFVFLAVLENEFLYQMIGHRFEGFFSGLFGDEYLESSAVSRDVMLKTAWNLVLDNPWIGYGLNTFRAFDGSFSTWSHNNYLELWVSGGIFAVGIFYAFYLYALVKLIKIKDDYLAGMFFSYMLFTLVNDFIAVTYVDRTPMMMLALVAAFVKNGERKTD